MTSAAAAPAAVSSSTQGVKQASMAPMQVPVPPAEQRHNANAERGQVSQVGQHSSRPPVRFQTTHVEPEQPAQAERQTRSQGCKQTSRPYFSPQTENFKLLKDVPAECDPLSSMHPGVESGVDPSVPSAQAGLDEPVHSLDDTLSNALQELLLTEDRQDFALSIQVGSNMKHICFLHMPHKAPAISVLFSHLSSEIRIDTQSCLPCVAYLSMPCCAESQSAEHQLITTAAVA